MAQPITTAQLCKLQTLWGQRMHAAGVSDQDEARDLRYQFIAQATSGRAHKTKELSYADARLILQLLSGQGTLRIADGEAAWAAGNHGRRDVDQAADVLAGEQQFAFLRVLRDELGWDQARLDAFIAHQLGGRPIRTMGNCNKVAWALKAILRRKR